MTISQIGQQNKIISFKSGNQVSLEKISDTDLYRISNTSDEFLKANTQTAEAQKFLNNPMRKAEKNTSHVIPVGDTLLTAALTPGNFGDKVFAGINRAVDWGVFIKITDSLSKKLNKNETYRNFAQEHPATTSLVGSLAVSSIGILGYAAVKTGFNKLIDRYKPAANLKQSIYQDLNNLSTGKTISDFANKNRKYTTLVAVAGFVGVVGLAVNNLISLARMKNNADKNAEQYKNLRFEASKELNNRLLIAQDQ